MKQLFCDHCGNPISQYCEHNVRDEQTHKQHDLCWDCMNELKSIIEKMEQAKKNRITAFLTAQENDKEKNGC